MKLNTRLAFIIIFGHSMQLFSAEQEPSYLNQTTILNTSSNHNDLSFLNQTTEFADPSFLNDTTILVDTFDQTTVLASESIELGTPLGYEKVETDRGTMYLPNIPISPINPKGFRNKENQLIQPVSPCKDKGGKRKAEPLSPIKQQSPSKKTRTITFNQHDGAKQPPNSDFVINDNQITISYPYTTTNQDGDWLEHALIQKAVTEGREATFYLEPFFSQVKALYQAIENDDIKVIMQNPMTPLYNHTTRKNVYGETLSQTFERLFPDKDWSSLGLYSLLAAHTDSPVIFAMKKENINLPMLEVLVNKLTDQEQQTLLKLLAYDRDFQLTPSVKFILSFIFEKHKAALGEYEASSIFKALFIKRLIFLTDHDSEDEQI